jgi:hypothetical protein
VAQDAPPPPPLRDAEHLEPLARVLKPGAEFRVATDIPDYVRQTLQEVPRHGFTWLAEGPSDWREPWDDWLSTRYEQKALREGRVPHYLTFRRASSPFGVWTPSRSASITATRPKQATDKGRGGPCPATAIRYR